MSSDHPQGPRPARFLPQGFRVLSDYLDRSAQVEIAAMLRAIADEAPLVVPSSPNSGRPFDVAMTNCGPLGWTSGSEGHRYRPTHPLTGRRWPPIPPPLLDLWWRAAAPYAAPPECALITLFPGPSGKLGWHRDADEDEPNAPIVSLSLGDTARFLLGTRDSREATASESVSSGTVVVLAGEARHCFHAVDGVRPGSSSVLEDAGWPTDRAAGAGRLSVTLRRVTPP